MRLVRRTTAKDIDLPETLSNLTGKRIRGILPRLTPMGAGVDSDRNSMTEPTIPFDSGGACNPPGLDERGIKMSQNPQQSFIITRSTK